MPVIIEYFIKVNICLAVVYLFYYLFLRKLTFYNWNRWYLLGYSLLSFIIPVINIMPQLQKRNLYQTEYIAWIPSVKSTIEKHGIFAHINHWEWMLIISTTVSILLLLKIMVSYISFIKMKKKSILIYTNETQVYQTNENILPFSFGNTIFINRQLHTEEEVSEIIHHEFVHVRQKHTIDIIWAELLCCMNWFTPFSWLLRNSIKQNLEFIADNTVLQNGFDKKEYQYLLLKVIGNNHFAFTNHFNFHSLQKRIAMMNTLKSAKLHMIKFLFLLPLIAVLLLAFRKEMVRELPRPKITTEKPVQYLSDIQPINRIKLPKQKEKIYAAKKDTLSSVKINSIIIRGGDSNSTYPLIILDGKQIEKQDMNNAIKNPNDIESIAVLKEGTAIKEYGNKGKKGVVIITTKTYKATNPEANPNPNKANQESNKLLIKGKIYSLTLTPDTTKANK